MNYKKSLEKILFIDKFTQENKSQKIKKLSKNEEEQDYIKTFIIIDAAKIKHLRHEMILLSESDYSNLFVGEDINKYRKVAPYLIELKQSNSFTDWIYEDVYGCSGAVFIHSKECLEELSKHFKEFITTKSDVRNPESKELEEVTAYVRLYDPRVLSLFINSLEDSDKDLFFKNIESIYSEKIGDLSILEKFTIKQYQQINLEEVL